MRTQSRAVSSQRRARNRERRARNREQPAASDGNEPPARTRAPPRRLTSTGDVETTEAVCSALLLNAISPKYCEQRGSQARELRPGAARYRTGWREGVAFGCGAWRGNERRAAGGDWDSVSSRFKPGMARAARSRARAGRRRPRHRPPARCSAASLPTAAARGSACAARGCRPPSAVLPARCRRLARQQVAEAARARWRAAW